MNILATCGVILLSLGQVEAQPAHRPGVDLESAVEQLGSSKYEKRQQATELLWSAGDAAITALELAIQSKNPEVRARAEFVLQNIRQRVAYNTPRETLREVQRFRQGDQDEKQFALTQLENANRPRIVLGLIQSEPDSRLRRDWRQNLERAIQKCIVSGSDVEVEAALREAAADEDWTRHWAAYLATNGKLEAEIARLVSSSPANPTDHARRLAYLFRAHGDLSEARRLAEQARVAIGSEKSQRVTNPANKPETESMNESGGTSNFDLVWELTLEQRDWSAAAQKLKLRIENESETAGKDPEALGFAAAYHRLAGDLKAFASYTQKLQQVADEAHKLLPDLDPRRQDVERNLIDKQWYAGKALLLNGRYDEAIQILRHNHSAFAFEILCQQHRFREACELAGVSYPNGFDAAWFAKMVTDTSTADDAARQKFALGLHALRQLHFLGRRDEVKQSLATIHSGIAQDTATIRRRMLADTAVKLGMRDLAIEIGAVVLEREGSPGALAVLYPTRQPLAAAWWDFFRDLRSSEGIVQTLRRIDQCLLVGGTKLTQSDLDRLIVDAERNLPQIAEPKRSDRWHALAETCLLHGQRDLALRFFEKAAVFSYADTLRLGDLHAAENEWKEAAESYRRATEFDKLRALPLYLYAHALQKTGREDEGRRLANIAVTLPLANDEARRELAAGIKERGFKEESLRQFELLARTGLPGEQDVIEASKQIGNAVYAQDELRGAECWESMILCCLRNKWGFVDANGYLQIPFLVHKTRAKGFLKAGRLDEASRELWESYAVLPLNLELPEELLPELQKANCGAEADKLFDQFFRGLTQQCEDFPNCATLHNNLAWLCARNRRELDAANEHAQRALQLDPNNPAYIDTQGEVHFHRGRLEEAIACADRCLKIEPRSKHYQEQLARFNAAKAGGN